MTLSCQWCGFRGGQRSSNKHAGLRIGATTFLGHRYDRGKGSAPSVDGLPVYLKHVAVVARVSSTHHVIVDFVLDCHVNNMSIFNCACAVHDVTIARSLSGLGADMTALDAPAIPVPR